MIKVTKNQIIKVLKTTPATMLNDEKWLKLKSGAVLSYATTLEQALNKGCTACAAGVVMLRLLKKEINILSFIRATEFACSGLDNADYTWDSFSSNDQGRYQQELRKFLKKKQYMASLVYHFEWEVARAKNRVGRKRLSRHQKLRIKNKLLQFVNLNFPETFKINVANIPTVSLSKL